MIAIVDRNRPRNVNNRIRCALTETGPAMSTIAWKVWTGYETGMLVCMQSFSERPSSCLS